MKGGRLIFPRRLRRWPIVVALALALTPIWTAPKGMGVTAASAGNRETANGAQQPAGETGAADSAKSAAGEIGEAAHCAEAKEGGEVPAVLRANRAAVGKIALTFDDGPHPTLTAPILDLLAEYGVHATFFVIGVNAEAHPELIARELAEGHEVENHTMTHPDLSKLSYREALDEITEAESAIFPDGEGRSRFIRPPGGAISGETKKIAARLECRLVLWSVDTRDWAHTGTEEIVRAVRGNVSDGDVILFHDYISGEAHTLDALRELIPALIGEGCEFVTLSDLFGSAEPKRIHNLQNVYIQLYCKLSATWR